MAGNTIDPINLRMDSNDSDTNLRNWNLNLTQSNKIGLVCTHLYTVTLATSLNDVGSSTTTIWLHFLNFTKFQILKGLFNLHKFTRGQSHKSVFNFCTRSDNISFLALLRDNILSNEYTISGGGSSANGTTSQICIRIPYNLNISFVPYNNPCPGAFFFYILECELQYSSDQCEDFCMNWQTHYIRNIKSCNININEFSHYQLLIEIRGIINRLAIWQPYLL